MAIQTEGLHGPEFMLGSKADRTFSRDKVTLISGQNLVSGTVLGEITTGTSAIATAFAGNTGNGAMGAITVSAGAKTGTYKLIITEPGTNVGNFVVEDPDGIIIGQGDVAAAFSAGGLAFTLADGATDFVAGDGFNIAVAAGSGKFTQLNLSGADGSQHAVAILRDDCDASGGDKSCVVIARAQEVIESKLTWPAGITTDQKNAAIAELAAAGIIVRS